MYSQCNLLDQLGAAKIKKLVCSFFMCSYSVRNQIDADLAFVEVDTLTQQGVECDLFVNKIARRLEFLDPIAGFDFNQGALRPAKLKVILDFLSPDV